MPNYRLSPDEFASDDNALTEYVEQAHTVRFVSPHQRDARQSYFDNDVTVEFDADEGPAMHNALLYAQRVLGDDQSVFSVDGQLNVVNSEPQYNHVDGPVGAYVREGRRENRVTLTLDDTTVWLTRARGRPANLRPELSIRQARQLRDQLDDAIDEAIDRMIPSARLEREYENSALTRWTPEPREDPIDLDELYPTTEGELEEVIEVEAEALMEELDENDTDAEETSDKLPPEWRNEESDDDDDGPDPGLGDLFG